jgi:hypothetical protein
MHGNVILGLDFVFWLLSLGIVVRLTIYIIVDYERWTMRKISVSFLLNTEEACRSPSMVDLTENGTL